MLLLWALGCPESTPVAAPRSRFDAVLADPSKEATPADFCETLSSAETAPKFPLPQLAGAVWEKQTRQRWINVWATWCGPCVAEMPRLVEWQKKLAAAGTDVELVFLSVDAGQPELDRFYAKHPGFPPSVRMDSVAALPDWLAALDLDAGTPIPIHLFVDTEGRTRCVRTGAVSETDYGVVRKVLGG